METRIKGYDISMPLTGDFVKLNDSIREMEERGYNADEVKIFRSDSARGWYEVIIVYKKENNNVTTKSVD